MLGFHAEAPTTEITVDKTSSRTRAGSTRDWLLLASRTTTSFRLPRRNSIARRLIEDWLEAVASPSDRNSVGPKDRVDAYHRQSLQPRLSNQDFIPWVAVRICEPPRLDRVLYGDRQPY